MKNGRHFQSATGATVILLVSAELVAQPAYTRRLGRAAMAAITTETTCASLHHEGLTIPQIPGMG